MAYIIDADVFIRAKNQHYGFDFCPAFWDWLIQANENGQVFSIRKVGEGIMSGRDELADWATKLSSNFFLHSDSTTYDALKEISDWIKLQDYEYTSIEEFLKNDDYHIIGHALAGQHTVVTHEVRANSKKKIKIPDVCFGLGVPCMDPFRMLRNLHPSFVLETSLRHNN